MMEVQKKKDNLKILGRVGEWRELYEGTDRCMFMADSCCSMAETNTTL